MKVGDLVWCISVERPVGVAKGIIVEYFKVSGLYGVMMTRNNRMCAFQPQHLRVINARTRV